MRPAPTLYRKILTLGRHTVVYGLGSVATRLLGFLLIPVYTRYMTPADYGVMAICTTSLAVLKIIATAGVPSAMFRSYLLASRSEADRERVVGTSLLVMLALALPLTAGLVLGREPLGRLLFGDGGRSGFVVLIAAVTLLYVVQAARDAHFRMHDQSHRYALFTLLAFALNLAAALYLVVGRGQGAWGAVLASVLATAVMAALFLPWAVGRIRCGPSRAVVDDLLSFGLPLIPAALALWVMNLSDIHIVRYFHGEAATGLYNLGYRFGLGIYILTSAFKLAFPKLMFSEADKPGAAALFSRLATYHAAGLGFICLGVSLFAPEIILVADARFHAAWPVIPLAVFAYYFFGLVSILEVGLDIHKKTGVLAALFVGGAAFNVGLNLLLVPRYGMLAAAATTLATYVLLPAAVHLASNRYFPVRLEWGRLARVGIGLAGAGGLALLTGPLSLAAAVGVKLALLLAFPLFLLATRFATPEEMEKIRAAWRRRRA